ncbi:MAG TPA: HAMP domain-containing sensor histidine kinase [Terracidiphilus sp.]|nr:HAMP domain-containing sensor histidine kinase [Terracidiphilus sp.]
MTQTRSEQFNALSDFLGTQRETILQAWRKAADADPKQTTMRALTRGQFNDHIPQVLDAFERKLRARPGGAADYAADILTKREEVKHGLHRWQQGYRLQELMHEWGHLQLCIFHAVETFAATHAEFEREALLEANHHMITLVNEAISESTAQYERMQQAEAAGRLSDLEGALAGINEIERRRAALIHEAVHDINGNVYGVAMAAKVLAEPDIAAGERADFTKLLEQGVQSVSAMLTDLMELARLEAGRETREIREFDAAVLVAELGNGNRPVADGRGLFLEVRGPSALSVEGDPGKVRRLLQNLLLNALKYTGQGGVTVSFGIEEDNWWVMVKDTGPGMLAGPGAPMVVGLKEATASARESDEKATAVAGKISHVLVPAPGGAMAMRAAHQQLGEGVGLSIVKRLCELLDASLEMASSAESGTTFRVVLPRHY